MEHRKNYKFAWKQLIRILMVVVLSVMLQAGNAPLYDLLVETQLPPAALDAPLFSS